MNAMLEQFAQAAARAEAPLGMSLIGPAAAELAEPTISGNDGISAA